MIYVLLCMGLEQIFKTLNIFLKKGGFKVPCVDPVSLFLRPSFTIPLLSDGALCFGAKYYYDQDIHGIYIFEKIKRIFFTKIYNKILIPFIGACILGPALPIACLSRGTIQNAGLRK